MAFNKLQLQSLAIEEAQVGQNAPTDIIFYLDATTGQVKRTEIQDLQINPGGDVTSVNGKVGTVVLNAADVGAKPSTYTPSWAEITGKPNVSVVGHTHTIGEVSGTVPFAQLPTGTGSNQVAVGNHNHNTAYAPIVHQHQWSDITSGVPVYATRWPTVAEINAVAKTGDTMSNTLGIVSTAASFKGLDIQNNGNGWSYLALGSGTTEAHIAHSNLSVEGALSDSLHLRPKGVKEGSLALQPNSGMFHQTQFGTMTIGCLNGEWAHFQTNRPAFHFDKNVHAQGEFYAGANYNYRVYHQGFKPTAAELGASTYVGYKATGGGNWTTQEFLDWLSSQGAFATGHWTFKGTWDYAGNRTITDTGCGYVPMAGSTIEVVGNTPSQCTITVKAPTTTNAGGTPSGVWVYNNQGPGYIPAWRRLYTTATPPTALEVGALPIGGGTMTGNLHSSTGGIYPAANNASQLGNSGWWWNSAHITNITAQNITVTGGISAANRIIGSGSGSLYTTAGLEARVDGGVIGDPSVSFHKVGNYAGTLRMVGANNWAFVDQTNSNYGDVQVRTLYGSVNGNATSASSVPWAGVTGKPSTFPPNVSSSGSFGGFKHTWDAGTKTLNLITS